MGHLLQIDTLNTHTRSVPILHAKPDVARRGRKENLGGGLGAQRRPRSAAATFGCSWRSGCFRSNGSLPRV